MSIIQLTVTAQNSEDSETHQNRAHINSIKNINLSNHYDENRMCNQVQQIIPPIKRNPVDL